MMRFHEYIKEEVVSHDLSGVILIYNNKILLVRPKKFKNKMKKWSIPKGRIENKVSKIETALKELEEESRIKLKKRHLKKSPKVILEYIKSGDNKKMTCYIVRIEKEDMNVRLFNDMILGNFLKGETVEAGFFTEEDAKKIIEKHQLDLLKFLEFTYE